MSKQEIYTKEFTGVFTFDGEQPNHLSDEQFFIQALANKFHFDTHQHTLDLTCHLLRAGYIDNTIGIELTEFMCGYFRQHGIDTHKTPLGDLISEVQSLPGKYKTNTLSKWAQGMLYKAENGLEELAPLTYDSEGVPVFYVASATILKPFEIGVAKSVKGDVCFGTRNNGDDLLYLSNPSFLSNIHCDYYVWDNDSEWES